MSVPFDYVGGHLISIPVRVNESIQSRLIFDTGIGLNLISKTLFAKAGCRLADEVFAGKRMSGQEIKVQLTNLSALSVGSHLRENVPAGIFDMSGFQPELRGVEGFVSLQFFEGVPVTVDSKSNSVVLETENSMKARVSGGVEVPTRVERSGPSVGIFVDIDLPGKRIACAEVDTGSDALILNSKFMEDLGVHEDDAGVRKVLGKDETGNSFTRYFTKIRGPVSLSAAPRVKHQDLDVIFQDIIYDGLLGRAFLKQHIVTYDVARSRMIFAVA